VALNPFCCSTFKAAARIGSLRLSLGMGLI
jgi:hypothetical protein